MSAVLAPRPVPLAFQIGARTLFRVDRTLARVALSLEDARSGRLPPLPPLPQAAHGYAVTSLPEAALDDLAAAAPGMIPFVRQRYTRYWAELGGGFDAWFAGLSANARQSAKRKAKKVAQASGGAVDVRRFRTPAELEAFHAVARGISERTYQERLLGGGLPEERGFVGTMLALAAANRVRAWLLYVGDEPVAYLYCPVEGDVVIYAHVGHDPAYNELSPGAVLQLEAMRDLFAEGRFARFDFTEGEGQHKRQFATDGVTCGDLLLLRPTLANRLTVTALVGFDGSVARAKALVGRLGLEQWAKRVRRG